MTRHPASTGTAPTDETMANPGRGRRRPPAPTNPPPTLVVYGRNACRALFERRPGAVVRVFLCEDRVPEFSELLRHCARHRLPYRIVPPEELERVCRSRHHEGICIVSRRPRAADLGRILGLPGPGWALALPGVGNPHNLGAIVRTAAHFGARCVLAEGPEDRVLAPSAWRTAEGGAEWVPVVWAPDLGQTLGAFREAGYGLVATSSHQGDDLFRAPLPDRCVLLLGAEGSGLSAAAIRRADLCVRIPGTGRVESLNVATAAGVLLAELWRRHANPAGSDPDHGPEPG